MAFTDFYRQARWINLRKILLQERLNEEGMLICDHCGKPILHNYDAILHHKTELTPQNINDPNIAYNPENLAFVHAKCHNEIHNRFGGRIQTWQRKVYYIYGAPCSGKSTFVRNSMQAGDLVLDMDKLWEAMSGQPEYRKPNSIKANVFMARNAIIDSIKTRMGHWQTAWVIEGGALQGDRMRRIETLGAEAILIDTPRETCINRLASDETRQSVQAEWVEYINKWFDEYQPDEISATKRQDA